MGYLDLAKAFEAKYNKQVASSTPPPSPPDGPALKQASGYGVIPAQVPNLHPALAPSVQPGRPLLPAYSGTDWDMEAAYLSDERAGLQMGALAAPTEQAQDVDPSIGAAELKALGHWPYGPIIGDVLPGGTRAMDWRFNERREVVYDPGWWKNIPPAKTKKQKRERRNDPMGTRISVILCEGPGLALDDGDMAKLALEYVRQTGQQKRFLKYLELAVHDQLEKMVIGTPTQVVSVTNGLSDHRARQKARELQERER
ncbi:MAG: hypothetical protein M0Z41_13695 [Peptococcaceae bacterium]|nr:hypothetical protein [Peptococcaceae bacterium]